MGVMLRNRIKFEGRVGKALQTSVMFLNYQNFRTGRQGRFLPTYAWCLPMLAE